MAIMVVIIVERKRRSVPNKAKWIKIIRENLT